MTWEELRYRLTSGHFFRPDWNIHTWARELPKMEHQMHGGWGLGRLRSEREAISYWCCPLPDPRMQPHPGDRHAHSLHKWEQWRDMDLGREGLYLSVSGHPGRSTLLSNAYFKAQTGTQPLLVEGQHFMRKCHCMPTNPSFPVSLHYIDEMFWYILL